MSNRRNYTLLPSSSLAADRSSTAKDDDDSDADVDPMGSPSEESGVAVGYPVPDDDLLGKTAVQAKTALVNRALEETGMGRYQWCMCVAPVLIRYLC